MTNTLDVTGWSPAELDTEVQALLWDHKIHLAVHVIEKWIDWDQYGRWQNVTPEQIINKPTPRKNQSGIADRIKGEFGSTGPKDVA